MAALEVCNGTTGMEQALAEIDRRIRAEVGLMRACAPPSTATEMLALEARIQTSARRLADLAIAESLVSAHLDPSFCGVACYEARERMRAEGCRHIEDGGWRAVHVRLAGGMEVRLHTRYLRPSRKGQAGRHRGTGRRGPDGAGCYPVLERLGIEDGVTPAVRSEVARQMVLCGSLEEAGDQLAREGLDLHPSTVTRIAVKTGREAVERRDAAMETARVDPTPEVAAVAGKRLRVSVDGGRARTRHTHRGRGIRPGKNGRRPFTLEWKEPRVITVDVLDAEGEMDRDWKPIYEVTLGDADQTCALLEGVLRAMGAHLAAEVVFVSDGAEWIWNRISGVLARVGIPTDRIHLTLDYYHAAEHVTAAIDLCRNLTAGERSRLAEQLRPLLLDAGGPARVVSLLRALARGRRGRKVNREADYLERHLPHMRYAEMRAVKLPIGSGIVESAVRRVINLRFKSASMCWRSDHLLPLLYLRAIAKAGRWDQFIRAQAQGHHWLQPGGGCDHTDHGDVRKAA